MMTTLVAQLRALGLRATWRAEEDPHILLSLPTAEMAVWCEDGRWAYLVWSDEGVIESESVLNTDGTIESALAEIVRVYEQWRVQLDNKEGETGDGDEPEESMLTEPYEDD